MKYVNNHYNFPIMTKQELELVFDYIESIKKSSNNQYEVFYSEKPEITQGKKGLDQFLN